MIITDKLLEKLEKENKPIRVGIIGTGFMGKAIMAQIEKYNKGMTVVAACNRTIENAKKTFIDLGIKNIKFPKTQTEFEKDLTKKNRAVTDDPMLLCRSKQIDVILEVTGNVEYGAKVIFSAIKNHKTVVHMNAELDGTLGPILKSYADKYKVIYTFADGDQPGVTLNLYRFVKGIGLTPVLCGNIKGLHDPYRNPTTQENFAKKWGQRPQMVSSFADGTKISFEQAIIANSTGMTIAKRGMNGPNVKGQHVDDSPKWFRKKDLQTAEGIVDYVVDAKPAPGVFIIAKTDDPISKHYLKLYKLGEGPYYTFYTPYHLCHFEVPNTIARAFLLNDAALASLGKPQCDVVTAAKKDLQKGEIIDGMGGYLTYGVIEKAELVFKKKLLPIGLAEGCRLKTNIKKDGIIRYQDVEIPENRLADKLRKEQNEKFFQ